MRHFVAEPSLRLFKAGRAGLVAVRQMVTRDGKTFEQTIWRRPDDAPGEPDRPRGPDLLVADDHALDSVPDLAKELGQKVARAAQHITDRHVLGHLLHEGVLARLGLGGEPRLVESGTQEIGEQDHGLFPGDGEHHAGRVHVRRYAYPNGVVTIKRNHNALKIHVHQGSLDRPEALREMVKFKIRDKRYDGTERANDSPLTDWLYHGPTDEAHPHSVELSLYSRDPERHHADVTGDHGMAGFLAEPFGLAGSPEFLPAWRRAFELAGDPASPVFPGQVAPALSGVAQHFTLGVEPLLRNLGYQRIDNLPSHWNVVHFLRKAGYAITSPDDERAIADLRVALGHLNASGKARGEPPLTRAQESWVVLLQSPAFRSRGVPPPELDLGGRVYPLWINEDGTARNIWMSKSIDERHDQ